MMIIGVVSQALLYICFALLLGSFILYLVPSTSRPTIEIPTSIIMLALVGIAIFSFIPVLQLIVFLYNDTGFYQIIKSVLFTFEVGKSWVFTYILTNILFLFIVWFDFRKKALYAYIGILFTFALILAIGWSSHASSYDHIKGFISHTVHFTSVSVWIGILIVVSWFSINHINWSNFLKWFMPVAFFCLLSTIVTGVILMTFAVEFEDYPNSWMLPYGQALLLKHLLIIPLLVYATINGLWMNKKVKTNEMWNPIPWARVENIVVLLIFSATAAMGQQSPPHETIVTKELVSEVFLLFYQGEFQQEMTVQLVLNSTSVSFILLTVFFVACMLITCTKKASVITSFVMSIFVVICGYLSLIFSIQINFN